MLLINQGFLCNLASFSKIFFQTNYIHYSCLYIFIIALKFSFIKNLTPKEIISEYHNSTIVDPKNYFMDKINFMDYLEIQVKISNLKFSGFLINIYILESLSDEYLNKKKFFSIKKISQKFYEEILNLLYKDFNQDPHSTIIVVLSVKDHLIEYYKDENFFLGLNEKSRNTIINLSSKEFHNEKDVKKTIYKIVSKLEEYYLFGGTNIEIKLFAIFCISFACIIKILKVNVISNRFISSNSLFDIDSIDIFNNQNNRNQHLLENNREDISYSSFSNFTNVDSSFYLYKFNYYGNDSFCIYDRNLDKIKKLFLKAKINRQKYLQTICVICLEKFKNNKKPYFSKCLNSSKINYIENNLNRNIIAESRAKSFTLKDNNLRNSFTSGLEFYNTDLKERIIDTKYYQDITKREKNFLMNRRSLNGLFVKTDENPLVSRLYEGILIFINFIYIFNRST